jgi:hypothetical protein
MKTLNKQICLLAFWVFLWQINSDLSAQTNISGVVNTYTSVSAFTNNCPCGVGCAPQITVGSAVGFSVGDRVLIIQMQGADVDLTNTAAFGSITALNGAGLYELNNIAAIAGSNITLTNPLQNTYNPAGAVQMVRVPVYPGNVNVVADVNAQPWNGTTGGIIAFEAVGNVNLAANINADGAGFRGGQPNANNGFYCSFTGFTAANTTIEGGGKGEGVRARELANFLARGRWANGGGGGNNTNAGGAGGGGVSNGGGGGGEWSGCNNMLGGFAGSSIGLTSARLIMGGGGGAGHQNNSAATAGGNGGGIVIIYANSIIGNGLVISANSIRALPSGIDGAGGGGAGGIVALHANSLVAPLNVQARGGGGGSSATCHGNGGGGGGGAVTFNGASFPVGVVTSVTPGTGGNTSCPTQEGAVGATGTTSSASFTTTPCPLPVRFLGLEASWMPQQTVRLRWHTASEQNLSHFALQRSQSPQGVFETIADVPAQNAAATYSFVDEAPAQQPEALTWFYRVLAVGFEGANDYTDVVELNRHPTNDLLLEIWPNPVQTGRALTLQLNLPHTGPVMAEVLDTKGATAARYNWHLPAGVALQRLELPQQLSAGVYTLSIQAQGARQFRRFVVE